MSVGWESRVSGNEERRANGFAISEMGNCGVVLMGMCLEFFGKGNGLLRKDLRHVLKKICLLLRKLEGIGIFLLAML